MHLRNALFPLLASLLALALTAAAAATGAETALPIHPTLYPQWPWCVALHRAVRGDTCWALFQRYGLDLPRFLRMNPKLVRYTAPCDYLLAGDDYCVRDANVVTSFPPKPTPTAPPKATPPPPPPPPPPPSQETPKPTPPAKWRTYPDEVPCPPAWTVPPESVCFTQSWNPGPGIITLKKGRDPA